MFNPWKLPCRSSGENPANLTTGEDPPPPHPPDPPDPSSSLSPVLFPPLGTKAPKLPFTKLSLSSPKNPSSTSTTVASVLQTPSLPSEIVSKAVTTAALTPLVGSEVTVPKTNSGSEDTGPKSRNSAPTEAFVLPSEIQNPQIPSPEFTILHPGNSSPLNTNKASVSNPHAFSVPADVPTASYNPPVANPKPSPLTLVEKLRISEDRTLERLAPLTYSETGRPRVLIPDVVFEKGAALHKDFIICYYNGRAPPFNQIQSVFNHMWGKGKKLEIHNNPLNRTTIVRIPSEYLRSKILEKSIWYVGDTMFHTALWSSAASAQPPAMDSIKIWAHLTGVPLDLRHKEGLSLVAGLVGHPKETDAFTLDLVSLTLSHVKVEVDLTKPLPSVVEFEHQSGEVVEVLVSYPWLPSTCSHCKELGHIARNCLKLPPPPAPAAKEKDVGKLPDKKDSSQKSHSQPQYVAVKDHNTKKHLATVGSTAAIGSAPPIATHSSSSSQSKPQPLVTENLFSVPKTPTHKTHHKKLPLVPIPTTYNPFAILNSPHSPPDPPRPSLKRSCSSPTLSPPHQEQTLSLPPPSDIQIPATTIPSLGVADPAFLALIPKSPFPNLNLFCSSSSGSPISNGEPNFSS